MAPTLFARRPLHIQVRDDLMARIKSGEWPIGEAIPNESDLARMYQLSAGTVRRALAWMEDAKIVSRQQGRGTFVCDPGEDHLHSRYERIHTSNNKHLQADEEKRSASIVEANSDEEAKLSLRPGALVRRTTSTRCCKGRAFAVETATVPLALFPASNDEGNAPKLVELAKACRVLLGKGNERLRAVPAPDGVAGELGCAPGFPVVEFERTILTIDGRPAEWKRGHWLLADGYYLSSLSPELD